MADLLSHSIASEKKIESLSYLLEECLRREKKTKQEFVSLCSQMKVCNLIATCRKGDGQLEEINLTRISDAILDEISSTNKLEQLNALQGKRKRKRNNTDDVFNESMSTNPL